MWDLAPKRASLWWTSTYDSEEKIDLSIFYQNRTTQILYLRNFKILGCTMIRQGKTHECLEERMQTANKVWWKDVKSCRRKGVPWRVKCRSMVDHLYSVFCFGKKRKKMRRGQTIAQEQPGLPVTYG